jgi:hypothetical protein
MRRPCRLTAVLVLSAAALILGMLAPAFVGVETALAASGSRSLDVCVVEPGFATPGDTFGLQTSGPKNFNANAQLHASACGTYTQLPSSGTYTLTQSQTPSGWHLAQIYCYTVASAATPNGTVDLSSASATVQVKGPTTCIFAELPGGSGGFVGGSSSGSTSKSGTTKPTVSTTTTTTKTVTTVCVPIYGPNGKGGAIIVSHQCFPVP